MPEAKKIKLKKKRLKVKGARKQPKEERARKEKVKSKKEKPQKEKKEETEKNEKPEKKKEGVKLHYTALNKILRHGFRFSHPKGERKDWVECMGFLVGDVKGENVEINDAIPMVHGNLVEVEFKDEHYAKADEINQTLTNENWIVGWYHTHPGHGLFLSPVDKVNHSGYQTLNPSAVALVFDPSNFTNNNNFPEYIKIFKLNEPHMREKSDFTEIAKIDIQIPLSQVLNSIFEMSKLDGKNQILILEYGEKFQEVEPKPTPSTYLDADEVEKDLQEMRTLIKHLHKEVRVLHNNFQRHMENTNKSVEELKKNALKKDDSSMKCEFCGNSAVSADDAVCGHCGKPFNI
jgi:proteasome lid subunit RPN8/RPN11